ncbi:MAG: hypothetical protein CVU44_11605 [Chloroflexi bacterium HGW-Chloroflexi-6]|nr:MAG: hypothetical protein CVU44_11605 [Chloroflexi bacterium HGW-Chloroflexi-6]
MKRHLGVIAVFALLVSLLALTACTPLTMTPAASVDLFLVPVDAQQESLATPLATTCEACPEATLSALQTQEKNYSDAQAAATAAIMRADAQATLNASSATLGAALTQEQENVNIIAAQVAATEAIVKANAQSTLIAAGSTQSAARTQDAIRQTQMVELATAGAQATLVQQNKDQIAASTQTAVANTIATQTQSAAATSQWYVDQVRQREEEMQDSLWLWCPPIFIVVLTLITLLFLWRWMTIREEQQRLDAQPPDVIIVKSEPRPLEDSSMSQAPIVKAAPDNVGRWLDEVKRKLISNKKDDE